MRIVVLLLLCLLTSACVTNRDVEAPNWLSSTAGANHSAVLKTTKLAPDPHAGRIQVFGPVVAAHWPAVRRFMIRSWIDPGEPRDNTFELQVQAGFPRRVYLKQAYADGRELKTTVIDRERTDCGYECVVLETVGMAFTEAEIERRATSGLNFEIIGRRETIRMFVPAAYFAAVLEFHRRHRIAAAPG